MHEIGLIQPSIRPGKGLRATRRPRLALRVRVWAWAWRADSGGAAEAQRIAGAKPLSLPQPQLEIMQAARRQ